MLGDEQQQQKEEALPPASSASSSPSTFLSTDPWQVAWKHPTWQTFDTSSSSSSSSSKKKKTTTSISTETSTPKERVVVDMSVAQITSKEALQLQQRLQGRSQAQIQSQTRNRDEGLVNNNNDDNINDDDDDDDNLDDTSDSNDNESDSHWLLTVTLFDISGSTTNNSSLMTTSNPEKVVTPIGANNTITSSSTNNTSTIRKEDINPAVVVLVATEVVVELINCDTEVVEYSKSLVWPEILDNDNDNNHNNTQHFSLSSLNNPSTNEKNENGNDNDEGDRKGPIQSAFIDFFSLLTIKERKKSNKSLKMPLSSNHYHDDNDDDNDGKDDSKNLPLDTEDEHDTHVLPNPREEAKQHYMPSSPSSSSSSSVNFMVQPKGKKSKKNTHGLIAATLCRKPISQRAKQREASDIIHSMMPDTFLDLSTSTKTTTTTTTPAIKSIAGTSSSVRHDQPTEDKRKKKHSSDYSRRDSLLEDHLGDNDHKDDDTYTNDNRDEHNNNNNSNSNSNTEHDSMEPLYLACVSMDGRIHVYSVWDLLLPNNYNTVDADDDKENERHGGYTNSTTQMAQWLLGSKIVQQLESTWLPLSKPETTINLTILDKQYQQQQQQQQPRMSLLNGLNKKHQLRTQIAPARPSASMAWNPYIDTSTWKHCTVSNTITSIHFVNAAYPLLVVLGKGQPIFSSSSIPSTDDANQQTPNKDAALTSSSANKSTTTFDNGVSKNDTIQNSSATLPSNSIDHKEWWQEETKIVGRGQEENTDNDSTPIEESDKRGKMPQTKQTSNELDGGFITLCSTVSWIESKIMYLGFAPKSVVHVEQWHGMELLICHGDTETVAIRLDAGTNPIRIGLDEDIPCDDDLEIIEDSNLGEDANANKISYQSIYIKQYQILSVQLSTLGVETSDTSIRRRIISVNKWDVPTFLQICTEHIHETNDQHSLLLLSKFAGLSENGSIVTIVEERLTTRIPSSFVGHPGSNIDTLSRPVAWGHLDRGWSLFVTLNKAAFLCWEGTLDIGASTVLKELSHFSGANTSLRGASQILYLPKNQTKRTISRKASSSAEESAIVTNESEILKESGSSDQELQERSLLSNTLEDESDSGLVLTHREKSQKLLRKISSWTQLEATRENKSRFNRLVPVFAIRSSRKDTQLHVLKMRQLVVENSHLSPFSQVLGWLCQQEEYFTAASIALNLLHDADTLYHLWINTRRVDEEDAKIRIQGLLDGIIPVDVSHESNKSLNNKIRTQLADMTVGCLVKGGLAMSSSLNKFLKKNQFYDPSRAALMLVAVATDTVSGDTSIVKKAMGPHSGVSDKYTIDELLWPIRCLMEMAAARGNFESTLNLLNMTMPDEMRHRQRRDHAEKSRDLSFTESMIAAIVASKENAAQLLLALPTPGEACNFWESLDEDTRRMLAVVRVRHKYPFLLHVQVREWLLQQLHASIEQSIKGGEVSISNEWIKSVVVACLINGGCEIKDFAFDPTTISMNSLDSHSTLPNENLDFDVDDGIFQRNLMLNETIGALTGTLRESILDLDVLISCLLLLQQRDADWSEKKGQYVSTQELLDTVCYLAGRPAPESTLRTLPFDAPRLMIQCGLCNNIQAAGHLIGGKNGFLLQCCSILVDELHVSMDDAEHYFLNDEFHLTGLKDENPAHIDEKDNSKTSISHHSRFLLTESHKRLLWLLHHFVLSIQTFGDFEQVQQRRGRVNPVFASRSIFRAWFLLPKSDRGIASEWLSRWLSIQLGFSGSKDLQCNRLASAAIAQSLLWPVDGKSSDLLSGDSGVSNLLGHRLKLDTLFLIRLSKACCGLVESIPPSLAALIDTTKPLA